MPLYSGDELFNGPMSAEPRADVFMSHHPSPPIRSNLEI